MTVRKVVRNMTIVAVDKFIVKSLTFTTNDAEVSN